MISITKFWLTDTVARGLLMGHELGRAYFNQLQLAYDMLRRLHRRRTDASILIDDLTDILSTLDKRHDNKARAVYYHLVALRSGTEDPALASECTMLLDRFFPDKLSIINRSYVEEGGWSEVMLEQMTPALRVRLASIVVGDHTLEELFDAWLGAGMELSQRAHERTRLRTSVASTGASDAAIRANKARSRWINTIHTMLDSFKLMGFTEEQLESLLSHLQESVRAAEDLREHGEPEPHADSDTDVEPGVEPGTEPGTEPGAEASSGTEPVFEPVTPGESAF